ncbi:MAG: hypothetical protein V1762_03460 [Nitrospirota bacterium]
MSGFFCRYSDSKYYHKEAKALGGRKAENERGCYIQPYKIAGGQMDICAVCAWRETCQKKFSVSGKDLRCPDFARDVTIKEKTEEEKEEKKKEGQG